MKQEHTEPGRAAYDLMLACVGWNPATKSIKKPMAISWKELKDGIIPDGAKWEDVTPEMVKQLEARLA